MGSTRTDAKQNSAKTDIKHCSSDDITVVLAGNPNVGKTTVFNKLTGMHQHTGNWAGKTVSSAFGTYFYGNKKHLLLDVPGAYSLLTLSSEEDIARDSIAFSGADAVAVVCDASCLERNLNLVLQIMEMTPHVAVCCNLIDEAQKRGIYVDTLRLSVLLGVPCAAASARSSVGLDSFADAIDAAVDALPRSPAVKYPEFIETAAETVSRAVSPLLSERLDPRWTALRLLEDDAKICSAIKEHLGIDLRSDPNVISALRSARETLDSAGITTIGKLREELVSAIFVRASEISSRCVRTSGVPYSTKQLRTDRFLTKKSTGIPVMLLLLALIFYITISGANIISSLISTPLFAFQDILYTWFLSFGVPEMIRDALIFGFYRVLAWVVSVMLPPMAIFFPLFTFLEDLGYLPRVAFNLDSTFRRCHACGKQSLTTAMGFGCNAAAIAGCRIIDSQRERLIAIITNSFIPCNGRFPHPFKGHYREFNISPYL